jgi:CBS domain-containing protein
MMDRLVIDIMHLGAITCLPDTSLKEVARIMTQYDIREVVVVDETARICGVISDRLLAQSYGADLDRRMAEDILLPHPVTVSSDATLREAIALMQKNKIRNLVVVPGKGSSHPRWPVGIVSYTDIIQEMADLLDSHRHSGGKRLRVAANGPALHRLN